MTPQMAQPAQSAGQMLAPMSRQNGPPQPVTPSSTGGPLHGGPAGGWPGSAAGSRLQFNNQVTYTVMTESAAVKMKCQVNAADVFFFFFFASQNQLHRPNINFKLREEDVFAFLLICAGLTFLFLFWRR